MDLERRRALVARVAAAAGVDADVRAVELLGRCAAPDDAALTTAVGAAAARARLRGVRLDVAAAESSLRQSRPGLGRHPAHPPQTVGALVTGAVGEAALARARRFPRIVTSHFRPTVQVAPPSRSTVIVGDDGSTTTVALQVALSAAAAGAHVLWHGRLQRTVVATRLVQAASGVDADVGRTPDSVRRTSAAVLWLTGAPIVISDDPAVPLAGLPQLVETQTLRARRPFDLVVVDGFVPSDELAGLACIGVPVVVAAPSGERPQPAGVDVWRASVGSCGNVIVDLGDRREIVIITRPLAGPPPLMRDASGAVLGWRLWMVDRDRLVSPVRATPWPRGVTTATCTTCPAPPGDPCVCGIYAFSDPARAVLEWEVHQELVLGQVRGWGRVAIHDLGFRSTHAQLLALVAPSLDAERRRALADRYECPVEAR